MNQQFRPNKFGILPPVVKNLLIINGLFFLAALGVGAAFKYDLNNLLGLHYIGAEYFKPFQYVTYMFMHSTQNFSHILFNMFALWMFGNALENVWGSKRFLIYYIVTGLGAGIIYTFWIHFQLAPTLEAIDFFLNNPSISSFVEFRNSDFFQIGSYDIQNNFNAFASEYNRLIASNPSQALQESISFMEQYRIDFLNAHTVVGASGAVFGILLAFGMMFPNSVIYLYFAIPIKAKWFVILYGLFELYSGISNNPNDNVAHFAHLGGMVFGFLLIMFWKQKGRLH
ncbi:MAG: rhomboid family intramembrane serine protease [Bacteroidales bacterium]|jgi:membrane associated rhomboid family serine protease|nr:rhomboid family intramembrane serine protease [Bacteroidales bacterium]